MAETVGRSSAREPWREQLIGESPAMQQVIEQIRLAAPRRSTILITGETGTGKEVVARAIHKASGRGDREMVALNCGALPEALLEAELFGHAKGAFTGAVNHRIGRFEQADQSTIFLDEIGEMPLDLQSKLLRVLQEREFHRLGGSETIKVDVRVIAATNVDLAESVASKRFREDLYYRLNVICIQLPPLRQRTGDISLFLDHFVAKVCRKEALPLKLVSPAAMDRLSRSSWPGNVRQLEHATETAIVLSGDRDVLEFSDFPIQDSRQARDLRAQEAYPPLPKEGLDYEEMIARFERYVLAQALEQSGGNKSRAADLLRLKRSTLVSKIKVLATDAL
jgi:transcriptional regulator with PAS, ATPase and Fis domain